MASSSCSQLKKKGKKKNPIEVHCSASCKKKKTEGDLTSSKSLDMVFSSRADWAPAVPVPCREKEGKVYQLSMKQNQSQSPAIHPCNRKIQVWVIRSAIRGRAQGTGHSRGKRKGRGEWEFWLTFVARFLSERPSRSSSPRRLRMLEARPRGWDGSMGFWG